jgi:hypothetical protein
MEKFSQVFDEFTADLFVTFPELKETFTTTAEEAYAHCTEMYPKIFFEILYENESLFTEDRFLLPGVNFTLLMNDPQVTEKTKKTIWKYLQLVMFAVLENVQSNETFGDTSKLFEAVQEEELHKKIAETMEEMKGLFGDMSGDDVSGNDFIDPEKAKSHLDSLMNGKIGSLAKEIAEEAAKEFGEETDPDQLMKTMMKNPQKILSLVKNIGGKLDEKIKSGDVKESELLEEASEIMKRMKDMPGLKEMMSKMGMNGKMDFKAMANKMQETLKTTKMKERLNKKREANAQARAAAQDPNVTVTQKSSDTFVVKVDDSVPKKSKAKKKGKK